MAQIRSHSLAQLPILRTTAAPFVAYANLALFILTSVVLVALEQKALGFTLLAIAVLHALFLDRLHAKNMLVLYGCLMVLGVMPIVTSTALPTAAYMGLGLAAVVVIPYVLSRYVFTEKLIRFPSLKQSTWRPSWTLYLLFIALVTYFLLPFMLKNTGAYMNWQLQPGFSNLLEAYIGLNIVGIWDELFFVCTVLAILQRFYPFHVANVAQAVLFTSFLYSLAFTGWSFILVFIFALLQGYVFRHTKSLLFILAIHLTVDLVLHLALVHLQLPELYPWMIS